MIVRRRPDVLFRQCLDGVLLLVDDGSEEELLLLAPPGDLIWELLGAPQEQDQLVVELSRRFEVDPGLVAADVAAFVDQLRSAGAVEGR